MANKNQRSVTYPGLPDTYVTNQIAAEFSTSASYAVGDYCNYLGQVYRFNAAHSGAWTGTDADAVYIAEDVKALVDSLDALEPGALESWARFAAAVKMGRIRRYLSEGSVVEVLSGFVVTADTTVTGGTASVTKDTFIGAVSSEAGLYVLTYDGAAWYLNGTSVNLGAYGISVTGTPAANDTITVRLTAGSADYNVLGIDEDEPVDPDLEHVVTIQKDTFMGRISFDPVQYLFAVTAESLSSLGISGDVLPAGTYNVTLDHGANSGGTGEDGTYQFTTTVDIPIGGGIRHSTMGGYHSASSGYTKANITGGTFITYDADTLTTLESGLTTTEGSGGISLGTATATNPTYKVGDYINFTQRQYYGSGRWSTSYIRQLLNSDDEVFAWEPQTIWSRNISATPEGFLHTLDPELRSVLCKVRKRYALVAADGSGYEDCEDYVTLATYLDIFGEQNNSINEGPVNSSGTVTRTTAYTYWKDRSTDADRIKMDTVAYTWWMPSASTSIAYAVRAVNASGALNSSNGAYNVNGAVPCLHIA